MRFANHTIIRRAFFALGILTLTTTCASAEELRPEVSFSHASVLADSSQTVYALIEFDIPEPPQNESSTRPEINLGLVIDRSGSMEDQGKMEYAKRAAQMIVDRLRPTDRLSVVEYDDRINVLWESSLVEAPDQIKAAIERLSPRGSTNLVGGMMRGVDQVEKHCRRGDLNRVILLSDGLANQGVTNVDEIKRLVREAKSKGVSITTMGLGLDYNEDLMLSVAEHSGGMYYYIESPTQIADIFHRELTNLAASLAEEATLKYSRAGGVKAVKVYGFYNWTADDTTTVEFGHLYGGDKFSLLLRFDIDGAPTGELDLGTLSFSYYDLSDSTTHSAEIPLAVGVIDDTEKVKEQASHRVLAEAALIEADAYHIEQVRLFEDGDAAGAVSNISLLLSELETQNLILKDVKIEKKIEALIIEAEQIKLAQSSSGLMSSYLKSNKQRFYQSQQGKRGMYLMMLGDKSPEVKKLEEALIAKGYFAGPADGIYDAELESAVKKYQEAEKIKNDGIAGPITLRKLGLY